MHNWNWITTCDATKKNFFHVLLGSAPNWNYKINKEYISGTNLDIMPKD